MRRLIGFVTLLTLTYGCGPPPQLEQMHAAYNTRQWAGVTERFADMGRPRDLDGIAYARVAQAAELVHIKSKSPAYRDLALDSYLLACEKDPSFADEHYHEMGLLLERTGDREGALRAYRSALAANPQHVLAAFRAADLIAGSGKPMDVISVAQGLMQVRAPVNRTLLDGLLLLSRAYAQSGRKDDALKVLRHAGAIGPADWEPDVLHGMARLHEADKENGKARITMRRAISMLPDGDSRRDAFHRYLQQLEGAAQAMAGGGATPSSDGGTAASPRVAPSPIAASVDKPDALPPPADNPQTKANALAARASVLADEGKTAEAIMLLVEAVELAPNLPAPAAQLAVLHVKQGDVDAAVAVLEKAIQNNPDNEVLKTMLGRIRDARGPASQPGS